MGLTIEDGTGKGFTQKVNANNRAYVNAVSTSESLSATNVGNAYNINTGNINIGSSTSGTGILYLKNNEDQDLVIGDFAVGLGTSGGLTHTSTPQITLIRNPTTGSTIASQLAVAMNQNRNFSSSKTLTADVYAGSNTWNFTNGDDIAMFNQTSNGRLFASISFQLGKGDTIGLAIQPNIVGAAIIPAYAAIICHLKDANEE